MISSPFLRQYAVVATVNLCSLSVGMSIGWSSPGLVKLRDGNQTSLHRPITEREGSWIVSFSFLAAILAVFAAAYLMDHIGRKFSVILAAVLKVAAGAVQILTSEVWVVMMTRAIIGGLDSIDCCVIPAYASEVASKEIRGALGTIFNIFIALGIVVMLAIGPFCSYTTLNILYTVVTLLATLPLIFVPESPYFMHSKGNKEQTLKVLKQLRGSEELANDEMKEYSLAKNAGLKVSRWHLFKDRVFLKSLLITVILNVGGQMMGHNVIMSYLQTILELPDSHVQSEIISIAVGWVSVLGSITSFFLMRIFGRKPILAVSMTGVGLSLGVLGLFFKIQESGYDINNHFSYMPLVSLVMYYFCTTSGFCTLSAVVTSELFDGPARATGIAVVNLTASITMFLQGHYFITAASAIGHSAVFAIFGLDAFVMSVFVVFCVPETKGRSFAEIQERLSRREDVSSRI